MPDTALDSSEQANKPKASYYSDYKFDLGFSAPKTITPLEKKVEKDVNVDKNQTLPAIPILSQPEIADSDDLLYTLRHFHLGDPNTIEKTERVGDDYVPALLHSYRDTSKIRYAYPLFLFPIGNDEVNVEQLAKPIAVWLRELVDSLAPGAETARILKDNLLRLERDLRHTLRQQEGPVDALELLSEAGQRLQQELELDTDNNAKLQADFTKLLAAIPKHSQILGYGRYAAIHLLNHAIYSRLLPRRTRFNAKIQLQIYALKELLDINWRKTDESIEPKMAIDSVGIAGSRFDPVLLSDVMEHSQGSISMSMERHERVLHVLQVLENYLQQDDPILIRLVHLGSLRDSWLEDNPNLESISDSEPCAKATAVFDQQAAKWAQVFSAARIAQLEIEGIYDTAIHDPWFSHFSWEAFSKAEMFLLPAVIALESVDRIAGKIPGAGMPSLSRLLSSGRPVHILVRVQAHNNPYTTLNEDPFSSYRFELGYFGISHRQAVVSQSSAARHEHLLSQYLSALEATRTSLHIFNTGIQHAEHGLNAWLVAGAALESRAHPFFHVNPEAGDSSADRMNFIGNPQPEVDWARHPFQYKNDKGETVTTELAFTYADYAFLVPRLRQHFRLVPVGYANEALVQVEEFFSTCNRDNCKQVPFIWAVNGQGEFRKLVVSRAVMFACNDRLNYWHTLQELAGIRNKYVDLAVQTARTEIQAEAQAERERLQAEHAEQLERVRQETAGEVMQRLTDVLLNLDLTSASPLGLPTTHPPTSEVSASTSPATEEQTVAEQKSVIEEEVTYYEDPWIDSDLCTSCNDCLNINTVLFVYNDSKQAMLGDLNTGTYAQLVEAAEICTARCIHPGKPRNPNEPGLEELIKRAEPFNRM